jgi:hypothetical protein
MLELIPYDVNTCPVGPKTLLAFTSNVVLFIKLGCLVNEILFGDLRWCQSIATVNLKIYSGVR